MSGVNFQCVQSIEPRTTANRVCGDRATIAEADSTTPALAEPGRNFSESQESQARRLASLPSQSQSQLLPPPSPPSPSQNSKELYLEAVRILLTLLDNVLNEPMNPRFRTIRVENKIIKEKLLSLVGCDALLQAIGFCFSGCEYTLPPQVPLQQIRAYRDVLAQRREIWLNEAVSTSEADASMDSAKSSDDSPMDTVTNSMQFIDASVPYKQRIAFPRVLITSNPFLQSLEHFSDSVMQYEDEKLLAAGRALIPVDDLTQRASEKLVAIQEQIIGGQCAVDAKEPCIRDLILVELVNWFKTEFFEWVNNVPCRVCGSEESRLRRTQIEDDVRIEVGICCGQETKFYRYNDVAQLLISRRGRCGEYANCFTFLCRCLDYEARIVHAFFDHVWSEVFSESQGRWLHVDPSDNVVDSPLMYQHGWKRNIDYVLAFSKDDLQDVTWRYTNNHQFIMHVRKRCTEEELVHAILALRKKRQIDLDHERRKLLAERCLSELIELTVERQPTENEFKGRSSGSLAWRQSRGEHTFSNIFVFTPNEKEVELNQFNLRYCCATDTYERYVKEKSIEKVVATHKTWQSAQYSSENIFRKVEHDWKMTYLARQEGSDYAELTWKFDFSAANMRIKTYRLHFEKKTYGDGRVDLAITTPEGSDNIAGATGFEMNVKLTGGKGDIAWQQTQLFRQSINSREYPFDLSIEFM